MCKPYIFSDTDRDRNTLTPIPKKDCFLMEPASGGHDMNCRVRPQGATWPVMLQAK